MRTPPASVLGREGGPGEGVSALSGVSSSCGMAVADVAFGSEYAPAGARTREHPPSARRQPRAFPPNRRIRAPRSSAVRCVFEHAFERTGAHDDVVDVGPARHGLEVLHEVIAPGKIERHLRRDIYTYLFSGMPVDMLVGVVWFWVFGVFWRVGW